MPARDAASLAKKSPGHRAPWLPSRRPTARIAGKFFPLLDPLETIGETRGGRSLEETDIEY